jgi:DNA-directed RNA polymerase subunit RPC12/RpoP
LPETATVEGAADLHTTHEMRMVRTAESELEEWACPSCGRRILLRWPPRYVKHVLDEGDEKACHIARITDDIPADDPGEAVEGAAAAPAGGGGSVSYRGNRRWLRETGADALHAPPSGLNPAEPV